jgi:hypothetical protein
LTAGEFQLLERLGIKRRFWFCDWLDNSEDAASKHYLQTTDDHFTRRT